MRTERYSFWHTDGRLRGTYVYMLCCSDNGPWYVKIGISDRPTVRLRSLRAGCPVAPQVFAFVEVRSRPRALAMESALLVRMQRWRVHGEWISFSLEDRPAFQAAWKTVFAEFTEPGWPLKWEQVSVRAVVADDAQRGHVMRRALQRRGRAYRDFTKCCNQ